MGYKVIRSEDNTRVSIQQDGREAWCLERDNDGRGHWVLYRVVDGIRGEKITRDQYSNDLIESVTSGLILAGHIAEVPDGYVVPVPADATDFYVSGFGYLCCRRPAYFVLTETPLPRHAQDGRLRLATSDEKVAAGLPEAEAAVFVRP